MTELTDNSIRVMLAIRRAANGVSNADLAAVRGPGRKPLGDPARKVAGRLEQRKLLRSTGEGKDRLWFLTPKGAGVLAEHRPEQRDEDGGSVKRPYHVLEEVDAATVLREAFGEAWSPDRMFTAAELEAALTARTVYVNRITVDGRNTPHARREARTKLYPNPEAPVAPILVAVADRMFQPEPTALRITYSVPGA